jgi:TRAP-type C4-dicarboxylate transport system permease small subunit
MHQKVLTFLIAILIIPVAMQILARFTEIVPNYIWTEEMSRFCLIWIIMIGASIAVRDGTHFDVDILRSSESIIGQVIGRCIFYLKIFLF